MGIERSQATEVSARPLEWSRAAATAPASRASTALTRSDRAFERFGRPSSHVPSRRSSAVIGPAGEL